MGQPLTTIMPTRFRGGHGGHVTRFLTTGEGKLVGQTTQLPALHADGHEVAIDVTLARAGPRPGASPAEPSIVSVLPAASTTILPERQLQVSRYLAATLRVTAALTEARTPTWRSNGCYPRCAPNWTGTPPRCGSPRTAAVAWGTPGPGPPPRRRRPPSPPRRRTAPSSAARDCL